MHHHRLIASFVALAVVAVAPAAFAENDDAEQLFMEGRRAAEAGDHALACVKLAESERLEPAPGTLANLADCEEKLGRLASAAEHFRLAASGFPKNDKRRSVASERAVAIERRVPRLVLTPPVDAPNGTVVKKDGSVVAASLLGSELRVDPGDVTVDVEAPGRQVRSYRVHLAERDVVTVALAVGDPPSAPPPSPPPIAPRPSADGDRTHGNRTIGYVLGSAGIASIATGVVLGLLALDRASTVKAHCDAGLACDDEGLDAAKSGELLAPLSTITIAAGIALASAGVYFRFSGRGAGFTLVRSF